MAEILETNAFANLANELSIVAEHLSEEERIDEEILRPELLAHLRSLKFASFFAGKALFSYRSIFKSKGTWIEVAQKIAPALEISERSLYRFIER